MIPTNNQRTLKKKENKPMETLTKFFASPISLTEAIFLFLAIFFSLSLMDAIFKK